ncbi:unnamed protein product [Sphagnum jensenii]|uniref:Uncharacterized protein n=1 Tax=Sphagnum jensenii TaxID=128206 RepID=A0ABP1AAU0_9BRYO
MFPSEETKVEAVEEEVNPLVREVYIEAYPVDILGVEENLNCLDELLTTETSGMLVRIADILEGLILADDLEVLDDDRSEIEVDDRLLRFSPEQTYFSVVESNDSAMFMENLDNPHAFPIINLEKEEDESSAQEATDGSAWHTLLGASLIYAIGGNEDEIKSVETDPSLDGNNSSVNLCSAQETVAESVDLSKSNNPSKENISHDGARVQKSDPVAELSVLDGREPCNQDNHDDANESEGVDTSNNAFPL